MVSHGKIKEKSPYGLVTKTHRLYKKILGLLIVNAVFFAANSVFAYNCYPEPGRAVSGNDISVGRDTPINSPLGPIIESPATNAFTCDNNSSPPINYQEFGVKALGTYANKSINGRRIYNTNIKGIGYAVFGKMLMVPGCSTIKWVNGTETITSNTRHRLLCEKSGLFSPQPIVGTTGVQFYKISETTGTGVVNQMRYGSFILRNNQTNPFVSPETFFDITSFNVITTACTIAQTVIGVPMGNIDRDQFSGVGSSPAGNSQDIKITLNCNKGTNINVELTSSQFSDTSNAILPISSDADKASGVGIQVLYQDKPVVVGKNFTAATTTAEGNYLLALKARYYQTDPNITPGKANGVMTINLSYL